MAIDLYEQQGQRQLSGGNHSQPRDLYDDPALLNRHVSVFRQDFKDKDEMVKSRLERLAQDRPEIVKNESANLAEALALQEVRNDPNFKFMHPTQRSEKLTRWREFYSGVSEEERFKHQWQEAKQFTAGQVGKTEHVANVVAGTAGQMIHGAMATASDFMQAASPAGMTRVGLNLASGNKPLENFESLRAMVEEAYSTAAPINPEHADSLLLTKLPAGATSLALFALTAGVGGAPMASGIGSVLGMDEGYVQALQREDPSTLEALALIAGHGALGATEGLPFAGFLGKFNRGTGGRFNRVLLNKLQQTNPLFKPATRIGAAAVANAIEEAAQEYGQSFYGELLNYAANAKDDRPFWDAVLDAGKEGRDNATVGAILGGMMGTATSSIGTKALTDRAQRINHLRDARLALDVLAS